MPTAIAIAGIVYGTITLFVEWREVRKQC